MKALNSSEIINKYLVFLVYFSVLLIFTVFCGHLYHKTCEAYANQLIEKKEENDLILLKRASISMKIDSINTLLKILNTKQVENEVALVRTILQLKNEASKELDVLEANKKNNYHLYRKVIAGIETAVDSKKALQQSKAEEEVHRRKLMECIDANNKAKKALSIK